MFHRLAQGVSLNGEKKNWKTDKCSYSSSPESPRARRRFSQLGKTDDIKQNLTNITDEDYDNGYQIEVAKKTDRKQDCVAKYTSIIQNSLLSPLPSIHKPNREAGQRCKGMESVQVTDLFSSPKTRSTSRSEHAKPSLERKASLGSTKTSSTQTTVQITTPSSSVSSEEAFSTPTTSMASSRHPAVRKIILAVPSPRKVLSVNKPFASTTSCVSTAAGPDSGECIQGLSHIQSPPKELVIEIARILEPQERAAMVGRNLGCTNSSCNFDAASSGHTKDQSENNLDDSLTNIQWLRGIHLEKNHLPKGEQKVLQESDIDLVNKECGSTRRPPFSYMQLIKAALNSCIDKRMTLREICSWIESKFPYYKSTAKPAWKNSIRHNLSLYNIFVREPAKRHGSYWTFKPDCCPKSKVMRQATSPRKEATKSDGSLAQNSSTMIPVIPLMNPATLSHTVLPAGCMDGGVQGRQLKKKKGPPPILPRPCPTQAYALIPIQTPFHLANQSTPIVLQMPPSAQTVPSLGISTATSGPLENSGESVNIISQRGNPAMAMSSGSNLIKETWPKAQLLDRQSQCKVPTSASVNQQKAIEKPSLSMPCKIKKSQTKQGLLRPKMYTTKQRARRKKQKLVQRVVLPDTSSSDEEILSGTERGILNRFVHLPESPEQAGCMMPNSTSTPVKDSPQMLQISPIQGLTPLQTSSLFDGSFSEYLMKDGGTKCNFTPGKDSDSKAKVKLNNSWIGFNLSCSPLAEFTFDQESPNSRGQTLSRFLAELSDNGKLEDIEAFNIQDYISGETS